MNGSTYMIVLNQIKQDIKNIKINKEEITKTNNL